MNVEVTNGKYDSETNYWTLNDGQFKT
ncbi:unnamed protein product, partial [Rotaria magnacalcarata]